MSDPTICIIEGCNYREPWGVCCRNCGKTNYPLLAFYGRVGKRAKKYGISRKEAMERMEDEEYVASMVEERATIEAWWPL